MKISGEHNSDISDEYQLSPQFMKNEPFYFVVPDTDTEFLLEIVNVSVYPQEVKYVRIK